MTMKTYSLLLLPLLAACPLQAAVIAYDNFDYTAGQNLSGLSGGAGFTTDWLIRNPSNATGTVITSTAGITVTPNHPTPGAGNGTYAVRGLPSLTTGTYYFSFLVDNVNDQSRFTAFSLVYNSNMAGNPTGGSELAYIGQANSATTWNINSSATGITRTFPDDHPASDRDSRPGIAPVLMVLKLEFDYNIDGHERLSLFIDPDLNAAEPAAPHIISTGWNFANGINAIWAGSGFSNSSDSPNTVITTYDDIRITTDWASLSTVPEPTRAVLLVSAFALLLIRRKRP